MNFSKDIQLNEHQTLTVIFTDEGIVYDVWDDRDEIINGPRYSTWKLYSEFTQEDDE